MKSKYLLLLILFSAPLSIGFTVLERNWITEKHKAYNLTYTPADKSNKKEYEKLINNGVRASKSFFNAPFQRHFDIVIHPDRHSLDSTWQKDWGIRDFKSECWMVASGVATKLDVISPKQWGKHACEHKYEDSNKTQQLITHELVHVYHGQLNTSPDFSNVEGIDWFVEGLATYASGQCDSARIAEVKKAIADDRVPAELDKFWTGNLKYGLSGSVAMFIDHTYGRAILVKLLPLSKKIDLLSELKITEADLLLKWKQYIQKL